MTLPIIKHIYNSVFFFYRPASTCTLRTSLYSLRSHRKWKNGDVRQLQALEWKRKTLTCCEKIDNHSRCTLSLEKTRIIFTKTIEHNP